MELLSQRYRLLAAVNCYHHYFLDFKGKVWGTPDQTNVVQDQRRRDYRADTWLTIKPIETSAYARLRDYGIIFKQTATGFQLIAEVDSADRTLADIRKARFAFALRLSDQYVALTALPLLPTGQLYLFSNEQASEQGAAFPDLALPYQAYSTLRRYTPGTLVKQGADAFMARLRAENINQPTANADFWRPAEGRIKFAGSGNEYPADAETDARIIGRTELVCRADLGDYSFINDVPDPDNPALPVNPTVVSKTFEVHLASFDLNSELQNL